MNETNSSLERLQKRRKKMTSDLDAMKAKLKDPEENFAETEKENARMGVEEAGVRTVAEVKLVKGAILDLSRSCTSETWGHVHLALTSFLHRVGSADSDHDGYCTICEDARWDTRFSCGHGYCCEQCAHGLVKKKGDAGVLCPVCNEEIEIVQRGDVVGSQPEFVLVEEICVDGILTKILGDWTGRTHGRGRHFGIWLMEQKTDSYTKFVTKYIVRKKWGPNSSAKNVHKDAHLWAKKVIKNK